MADLTRDEIEHLRGNWPPDSMASRLCDMALRACDAPEAAELVRLADCCNRQDVNDADDTIKLLQACASAMREAASALSAQQPVAWMLRGDVEQQTTVFFSYGQATYALEARTKSGWNQHIVPLYTSRQPAQSNVPVFGPNGNVSIMFSATKEQEEEHQRVIEASKAAFGLSTPAPQQGQTDAFSTLQAIRPFFADRLADGIDSTGERQTYELMLGIIDRASPPTRAAGAERAELVAALRLGRSAEDHLARQALLRKLGAA